MQDRRGRDSGSKKEEPKGNVIVSVRVRPDAAGDKSSTKEWLVDGRQSLVAYRGREGGDYYYGKMTIPLQLSASPDCILYLSSIFLSFKQIEMDFQYRERQKPTNAPVCATSLRRNTLLQIPTMIVLGSNSTLQS